MSWKDILDQINPFDFANAAPAPLSSQNSAESDPSVTADCAGAAPSFPRGFDPHAFMDALEDPAPLFLQKSGDADDVEGTLQEIARLLGRAA